MREELGSGLAIKQTLGPQSVSVADSQWSSAPPDDERSPLTDQEPVGNSRIGLPSFHSHVISASERHSAFSTASLLALSLPSPAHKGVAPERNATNKEMGIVRIRFALLCPGFLHNGSADFAGRCGAEPGIQRGIGGLAPPLDDSEMVRIQNKHQRARGVRD